VRRHVTRSTCKPLCRRPSGVVAWVGGKPVAVPSQKGAACDLRPVGSRHTQSRSIVDRYAVGLLQVINYRSNMSTEFFHRLLLGLLTRSSFSYGTSDLSCGVRCSIHVRTEAMVGTSCPSFFCMPLVWVCSLMNSPTFLRGGKPMRITMRCPPYLARRCSSC